MKLKSLSGKCGFPWWLSGKESPCQCRRLRFDPWIGKIPWRRKWQPLQYSWLGNPEDRGAWEATVHGVTKSRTWLGTHAQLHRKRVTWKRKTFFFFKQEFDNWAYLTQKMFQLKKYVTRGLQELVILYFPLGAKSSVFRVSVHGLYTE